MTRCFTAFLFLLLSATAISAQTLDWALQFSGTGYKVPTVVGIDASGNIFSAGYFDATIDVDPGPGTVSFTSLGYSDIYISKLDSSGNLLWSKRIGGAQAESPRVLAVTAAGEVIVGGDFNGTADFDPGAGNVTFTSLGGNDLFLLKLDAAGDLVWAKTIGSAGAFSTDRWGSLKLDPSSGDIVATGGFRNTIDMDPGPGNFTMTSLGIDDNFVLRLTSAGNFVWAKQVGSTNTEGLGGLAIDATGNILYTGSFVSGIDLDPGPGTASYSCMGNSDGYVSKLDAAGNFLWAKVIGGLDYEAANAMVLDGAGNIYYVGQFDGTVDFDPGPGTATLSTVGGSSLFLSKLDPNGNYGWTKVFGGSQYTQVVDILHHANGELTIGGFFNGTTDFDPSPATYNLITAGNYDEFALRLDSSGNFIWAFQLGSTQSDFMFDATKDAADNVYLTGHFIGTVDFDPGIGVYNMTSTGTYEGYLMKLGNCMRPDAPINTSTQTTICPQQSVTLTATGIGNIRWYAVPAGGSPIAVGGSYVTPILTNTTTYYVQDSTCSNSPRTSITVTVNPHTFATISPQTCGSYTSPSGAIWTSSGTYSDTIPNAAGCDSIITVQLSIAAASAASITADACQAYTSPSGQVWASSGTYLDTIPNSAGCDSIITVQLTIHNSSASTISPSVCADYLSPSGQIWSSSGTYLDTIPNAAGCDSIITILLTIITVDATVSNNAPMLTANAVGANYQWIYCDSAVISGATSQSFTAIASGNYAVIVTENGCSDTSTCESVVVNAINPVQAALFSAYPNPTSGAITLDLSALRGDVVVSVVNAFGQVMLRQTVSPTALERLQLPAAAGIYVIEVTTLDGQRGCLRVVRE